MAVNKFDNKRLNVGTNLEYALPKLSQQNFKELVKNITKDKFKNLSQPMKSYVFRNTPIEIKGKYLNPESLTKLHCKYPYDFASYEEVQDIGVQLHSMEIKYKLPSTIEGLTNVYKNLVKNKRCLSDDPTTLAGWLCLFCNYKTEFYSYYIEYLSNPDSNCTLVEVNEKTLSELLSLNDRKVLLTQENIQATCHILLISMVKEFNMDANHMSVYMRRRLKAVYGILNNIPGSILISNSFLIHYSDMISTTPKLMKMLFEFMYSFRAIHKELCLASKLLSFAGMATIKAILDFIDTKNLSVAHSNSLVLQDITKFNSIVKKKIKELGHLWPYYRVIRPENHDLNPVKFKYLATVAVAYKKKFGEETFKQLVAPQISGVPASLVLEATKLDTKAIKNLDIKKK